MLSFITENPDKIRDANIVLQAYSIQLEGKHLNLEEIQSDSPEDIILHKARYAFQQLKQPLVVKDDGWYFSALRGFPGPYMKYVNEWFTPEDFLNLLRPYENKEVIFREFVCYIDDGQEKIFSRDVTGTVLPKPEGTGKPSAMIVSFRKDLKSMAFCFNNNIHCMDEEKSVWHEFASWYKEISKIK